MVGTPTSVLEKQIKKEEKKLISRARWSGFLTGLLMPFNPFIMRDRISSFSRREEKSANGSTSEITRLRMLLIYRRKAMETYHKYKQDRAFRYDACFDLLLYRYINSKPRIDILSKDFYSDFRRFCERQKTRAS